MASPALIQFLPRFGVAAAVVSLLGLTGCQINNHATERAGTKRFGSTQQPRHAADRKQQLP